VLRFVHKQHVLVLRGFRKQPPLVQLLLLLL
jgi:hypothetical protein